MEFSADRSCIIDLAFVAKQPTNLLVISGHAKVASWDFERKAVLQDFVGHDGSVRTLSVYDDTPNLFATGDRDGTICIWDRRLQCKRSAGGVAPLFVMKMTHPLPAEQDYYTAMKGKTRPSQILRSKGITTLLQLDENVIISSSCSCETGIRFWDLRCRGKGGPFRILEDPNPNAPREYGNNSLSALCICCILPIGYVYSLQQLTKEFVDGQFLELFLNAFCGHPKLILIGCCCGF
ncbi:unnamed protein product [Gongylonema pulchrum]|uniref:WD_REPEATS_REGION domain-containing protein n=1 Tax=Gongylonema pulchrum TaxID=637853 RepID=A0A183DVL3_9BILA|nr:unnamed protein product [Gongylonema pulchrum]